MGLTSDAKLGTAETVNWKADQYIEVRVEEVAAPFLREDSYGPIIAEAALAVARLGFVSWTPVGEGDVVALLGWDTITPSWIPKENAKIGTDREILAGFQLYVAIRDIEPPPFFTRTHRDVTAHLLTRATKEEIDTCSPSNGFARVGAHGGGGGVGGLLLCRNSSSGEGGYQKKHPWES